MIKPWMLKGAGGGGSGIFYPSAAVDDGFIYGGGMIATGGYNYLSIGKDAAGAERSSFITFMNVTIPKGATITSAFLRLTANSSLSDVTCNVKCHFNAIDDAVSPTNYTEFVALALTTGVAWGSLSAWTDGTTYDTPSLVSDMQEVINRAGWASGQAMMVLLIDNASSINAQRSPTGYESGEYPALHVEWSA